ncbi:MAG: preprotein translocase subunit SecG [Sedimenticolaceae bacterium]
MMESVLVVVHLFLAIGLVGLILIQHGKGADMGAAFGSGASASVFGARGASNFLSRTTGILAALFFATSLTLAYFAMQSNEPETLMETAQPAAVDVVPEVPVASDVPVVPGAPAAPSQDDVPKVTE